MRISATNMESFRRWRDDSEAEMADLLAYLRRQTPPSPAMAAGSAFHKVLELAQVGDTLERVKQGGFTFEFEVEGEFCLPKIRELKLETRRVIGGEPVTLVGVVDTLEGRRADDHKLTARPDAENYAPSAQWRCYLDWFDCDVFQYNLFHAYQPAAEPGLYIIKDVVEVQFCRYPAMADEVESLVAEFVAFCKTNAPDLYNNERKAA